MRYKARVKNKKPPLSLNAYTGTLYKPGIWKYDNYSISGGDLVIKFSKHNCNCNVAIYG